LTNENQNHCNFIRRLAAIFYDSLLLGSVFFFATFALVPIVGNSIESGNWFYKLFLVVIAYFYFCWHWVKAGQTLGMRSWNVFVINDSGMKPDWQQSTARFFSALLSLGIVTIGFIWAIIDKEKKSLHDHLSKTRLIVSK
jgi:uncharacterized RDD family membrane protein YckC